jgi:hypothetical protein
MATDVAKILGNLMGFYDFNNKVIVSVGAGGGQLIGYGRDAKKVYAVDNDIAAIKRLEDSLGKSDLMDRFEVVNSDFYDFNQRCDVVLFEFCLHEMVDPKRAIEHAKALGVDIIVMDHWTESEWAYRIDEKEKVEASWGAVKLFRLKKMEKYDTVQLFSDYEELYQKIKVMGAIAVSRIQPFRNQKSFTIPMSYAMALI